MFKGIAIVGTGFALSFILALELDVLTRMHTPGWFIAKKLLAKDEDTNIGLLGLTANGLDFFLCFAILLGIYLLFAKRANPEER